MPKNTWRKKRSKEDPYYKVTDRYGDTYYVLKMNKDPRQLYASAYVICDTLQGTTEQGDVYVTSVPGLVEAWLKAHPEA